MKISHQLLSKILKNREKISNAITHNENLDRKKNRTGKDAEVEATLKDWLAKVGHKNGRFTAPMMRGKASALAKTLGKDDFVATDGWSTSWKKRENIDYKRINGERKNTVSSSDETGIKKLD